MLQVDSITNRVVSNRLHKKMSRDQPKALKHVTENVVTDSLLRDAIQRVLTSLCY